MVDERLQIETPENVAFGYEIAGIGSRFLSTLVDSLILGVLLVLGSIGGGLLTNVGDAIVDGSAGYIAAVFGIISFLIFFGYYVIFEVVWNGQTPGRRVFGMRVVDLDGVPIGLAAAAIRNLVRLIDFLPVLYGLGVVVMFVNRRSRRLGDLAAGTLVVFDRPVSLDQLAAPVTAPVAAESTLPLGRVSAESVLLAQDFLSRRSQLTTERRLIRPILQHLYDEMGVPLEERLPYDEAISRLRQIAAQ